MASCLTCTISTEPADSISASNNSVMKDALTKHFWFNEDECTDSVLCISCWNKIEDFYRFYCQVEETHCHQSNQPINVLDIKQEQQLILEPVAIEVKIEIDGPDDSQFEEDADDYSPNERNDSSTDDSSTEPVRKRSKKLTKAELAKINKYIAEQLKLNCSICSEVHPSFDSLQTHSMAAHKQKATIACCERKFSQKSRFYDHIRYHLDSHQLQCAICPKQCLNGEALKNHMDVKHSREEEKIYQCVACTKKFSRLKLLNMHRSRCHRECKTESDNDSDEITDEDHPKDTKPIRQKLNRTGRPTKSCQKSIKDEEFIAQNINLECDTCQQKHTSYQKLQRHSMDEHGKRAFVRCCDRKFTRKPRLIDHIQFHLNPMQFRCDVCSKQFKHSEALSNHKAQRHAEEKTKTFRCSMCPKSFSRQKFLNIHEKYHRKINEKNWHCQKCDKYFAFESLLRQHDRLVHTKEFSYVCHICARGFQVLSSYSSHLASHDEEAKRDKPPEERVQCKECNIWVYKQNFRKHMLRHTGSQTCEICGQECKSVMALRYHKAQHKRDDCFCSICGKTFKKRLTLKEHMASHTGEVLYSCDFCERTFNSHANRASHRKRMHPKEWLEDKLRKNPNFVQEQQDLKTQLQDGVG